MGRGRGEDGRGVRKMGVVEGGSWGLAGEGEDSTPSVSLNVLLTSKTPSSNIKHLPGRERQGGRERWSKRGGERRRKREQE